MAKSIKQFQADFVHCCTTYANLDVRVKEKCLTPALEVELNLLK